MIIRFFPTLVVVSFVGQAFSAAAWPAPKSVIFTRHAEKHTYEESFDGQVRQRGCERAFALPELFAEKPAEGQFERPVAVYAVKPSPEYNALRASQTGAPTAAKFDVPLIVKYTKDEYAKLAQEILHSPEFEGKTVLVVWEHHVLPKVAAAFGLDAREIPAKWPDAVFDEAWVLNFDGGGAGADKKVSLAIRPENLLPGDNPKGGKEDWGKGRNISDDESPCVLTPNQARMELRPSSPCANNSTLNVILKLKAPEAFAAVSPPRARPSGLLNPAAP